MIVVKLVLLAVAKKIIAYSMARTYGFPKLYGKMTTLNRKMLIRNPQQRDRMQGGLRTAFRLPNRAYEWAKTFLRNNEKHR